MELEELEEMLNEKRLTEIKQEFNEMNEYDIASLIEELPDNLLAQRYCNRSFHKPR